MCARMSKAVVGLGNPGPEFQHTRHNIGFLAVDRYLERAKRPPHELNAERAWLYGLGEVLIAKPTTYMNLSGWAVREILRRFELDPQQCLIVYDDVALPFGTLRARARGGAGGHHGMESVIEALGSQEIPRLRLGIRTDPLPDDLTSYVLGEFSHEESEMLDGFLDRAAEAIDCFSHRTIGAVMDEFNG